MDADADPELLAALDSGRAAIVDMRDPAEMLRSISSNNGFNPVEDATRLSKLSADELVALFDGNSGQGLNEMMQWADRLANQPGAGALRATLDKALLLIAERSPMRADRLRAWGVLPKNKANGDAGAPAEA